MKLRIIAAAAALLPLALACSKKPQECKQVVDVIDDDDGKVMQMAAISGGDVKDDVKAARDIASGEDKLASDLAALNITTTDLAKLSGDYQSFAKDVAKACRDYGEALDKFDGDGKPGSDLISRMAKARQDLDASCAKKFNLPECTAIKDKLAHFPDVGSDDAQKVADDLTKFDQDFDKIEVKDEEVKKEAAEFDKCFTDIITMEKGVAAFDKNLAQLKTREGDVTGKINTFCGG